MYVFVLFVLPAYTCRVHWTLEYVHIVGMLEYVCLH